MTIKWSTNPADPDQTNLLNISDIKAMIDRNSVSEEMFMACVIISICDLLMLDSSQFV